MKTLQYSLSELHKGFFKFFCFAVILIIAACNPKSTDKQTDPQADPAPLVSKKDLSSIKVGYCTPTLSAPFYVALNGAIQKEVEGYGMKFISVDGQGDIAKQITAVEDLMAKGINVLILNPIDPKALINTVNNAKKAGISVFIVDSFIEPDAKYISSILANNQLNGELVGEWIAGKMGSTPINAAIISGAQGNPVGKEKRMGVIRGIAETQLRTKGNMNFKIVAQGWGNWSNNGGLKAMEDILVAHPDINLLIAENDAMAMGAIKAIKEAGKANNVTVVGFDAQKEALEMIKQNVYGATALNSPSILGKLVVQSAVRYLNGETASGQIIYAPSMLINKDNVNKYYDAKAIF